MSEAVQVMHFVTLSASYASLIRENADALLTRAVVMRLMEEVRDRQPGLVEELLPNLLTISDIQKILQKLLREGVSIENIDQITEHLADLARNQKDPALLTEGIRQRMGLSICNQLRAGNRQLAVLSLDPKVENQIRKSMADATTEPIFALDPNLSRTLLSTLATLTNKMHQEGLSPVLLCGAEIRRHIYALTARSIPRLSVISVAEIPKTIGLTSFDIVKA